MPLETVIKAEIVAGVDKQSFVAAKNELKKGIKETSAQAKLRIQTDISKAQLDIKALQRQLKATKGEGKIKVLIDIQNAQAKLRGLRKDLQKVNGELSFTQKIGKQFSSSLKNVGSSIATSLINPLVLATAAMALLVKGVTSAIRVFQDFEKVEKQVQSIASASGATAEQLEGLEQNAKDLGGSTKFTAAEVASLQLELVKLGFTADEVIGGLTASTLDLAAAFGYDLADAAANTGAVLKIYGLDVSEAGRVNDILAKSFANSALDLSKFSTAITSAGPVANAFGFSLEETTALLGKLSDAGFDASSAGTATRNILLNLADANGKLAQSLGGPVENFDELIDGLIGLNNSGIDLAGTLELTDKRSVAAFNQFLNTAEGARELKEALEDSGGTAAALADEQLDTLDGSLTLLSSAVDGLKLSFGEGLSPAIRVVSQLIIDVIEYMKGGEDASQKFGFGVQVLAGLINALSFPFKLLISLTKTTIDVLKGLGSVVTGVLAGNFNKAKDGIILSVNAIIGATEKVINGFRKLAGQSKITLDRMGAEQNKLMKENERTGKAIIKQNKEVSASYNDIGGGGSPSKTPTGGGGTSQREKQLKEEEKALKELAKLEEQRAKEQEKIIKNNKKITVDARKEQTKEVENYQKALDKTEANIVKLQDKLAELGSDTETNIVDRVASIRDELDQLGTSAEDNAKKQELLKEEQEAFVGLTQEEKKALEDKIETQEEYNALTDIGKIKADAEEEKAILEEQIELEKLKRDDQIIQLQSAIDQQKAIESSYTAFFGSEIEERNTALQSYIDMLRQANSLGGSVGGGGSIPQASTTGGSTTTNTSNTSSSTNNISINVAGGGDNTETAAIIKKELERAIRDQS